MDNMLNPAVLAYYNSRALAIGKTKSGKLVLGVLGADAETYTEMGYDYMDHKDAAELHFCEAAKHTNGDIYNHHMAMAESHKNY